ncbi:hypothetical protein KW842_25235 [Duganella sp. sic0402]|uniref:hypothetical protein n=1 Tax=Duganella sp. sic0402 TaxID=2854786 RepID=UPI001C475B60|nr:hypothetical protein [Duganella sp. sic0402]MBV7539077.1 hypothetical protein [Duganella sp. sic0402]
MRRHRYEEEDTSTPHRTPKNLLSYIRNQSLNDDFMPLLAKHHNEIKVIIKSKAEIQEIRDAIFIIELNKFDDDLIQISKMCSDIEAESRAHQENIKKSREYLEKYNSKELIDRVGYFYSQARKYDTHFETRDWLPKINGRPFVLGLFFHPFRYNSDLPNEENICNLVASFNIHDNFFKNFLNTFYSDGTDGAEFLGASFKEISLEYKEIKKIILEVSEGIPKSAPEKAVKKIEAKYNSLSAILGRHPATLYSATRSILAYLQNNPARD